MIVAVKVIKLANINNSSSTLVKTENAINNLNKVHSPYIVELYHTFQDKKNIYMFM